jgi:probable phosphoglycerate mutase
VTTLIFVRHGETVWHKENRYAGSSDVDLTERGRRQAAELAGWASTVHLDAVVTSDLSRAQRTAAPVGPATGLPVRTEPRLREVHFGAAEGLTRAEMERCFPDALAAYTAAPATSPLPSAESGTAAIARAMPAVTELAEEFPDGSVLVVAHSTLNRLLMCSLLDIDPDRYRTIFPVVANVSPWTIRHDRDGTALLSANLPVSAS